MLFQLIQNLDKSEKRYFVLLTGHYKDKDSHYLKLYHYIVENEIYDDKLLKEHFRKESWIDNYTIVKKYLYEKLLKALRFYHTEKFERADFNQMYQNIQIFEQKGMTKSMEKEVKRLEKHLQQVENWTPEKIIYHEYLARQIQLKGRSSVSEEGHQEWGRILDEFRGVAQNLLDYIDLRKVSLKMREGIFCRKPELIKETFQSPIFQEMSPNYDFRAKLLFLRNFFFYYYATQEPEKSLESLKKMLDLFDEYPEKKSSFKEYNYTLSTYLNSLINYNKFEEFDNYIKVYEDYIKKVTKVSDRYQADIISHFLGMNRYIKSKNYETASKVFQRGIKKFSLTDITTYLSDAFAINFYAMGCRIYLSIGQYESILDLYNLIDESTDLAKWLQGGFHLHFYQMLAMYKFQHKYFDNELKKKVYFFRKHKFYKGNVQLFCKFLKALHRYKKPFKKHEILVKYRELFIAQKDPSLLGFLSWIDQEIKDLEVLID